MLEITGKERRTNTITFPLGPYHPALSQPLALSLALRGETVVALAPPITGYCHRGLHQRLQGQQIEGALAIIERSCSFAGTAHRIALSAAIESAANLTVGRATHITRALFAEIERILARLWLLGAAARAAYQTRLYEAALDQRETLFAALTEATDERAYWAVAVPGGSVVEFDFAIIHDALKELAPSVDTWRAAVSPRGPLGRAGKNIGVITAQRAERFGLDGVAGRGSREIADLRCSSAASGYNELDIEWPVAPESLAGDVATRLRYAADDLALSFVIVERCFEALGDASELETPAALTLPQTSQPTTGRATVAGPHGPATVEVSLTPAGAISELHLQTPAKALLAALPSLLPGVALSQTPLILASLDLCMECLDQ